jgi:hypothetical protein
MCCYIIVIITQKEGRKEGKKEGRKERRRGGEGKGRRKKKRRKGQMVVHTCNPSTQEHQMSKAALGYIVRPCLKNK